MIHPLLLHNDSIRSSDEPCLSPGQVGLLSGWGVFSTLRVASGVLFEFPRHFARMQRDAKLLRVPFPEDPDWLERRLLKLVEANRAFESTLRVCVVRNNGSVWQGPGTNRPFDLVAFTTDLADWGTGVKLGIVPQARHSENRFVNTKVLSWAFNLAWYEEAHERGYDEVILLNERDQVTECTSANIFIAQGSDVWTPPLQSGCLPGITRAVLLQQIQVPGYRVAEKTLRLEDLERADEVFITSSTRNVLPVAAIEGLTVKTGSEAGPLLRRAFEQYIADYVSLRQRASVPQ